MASPQRAWYDAVASVQSSLERKRPWTPMPAWLLEISPLASLLPEPAFHCRHTCLSCVAADGRALSLLPDYRQRDIEIQHRALLQILRQGVAWGARLSHPFMEHVKEAWVRLPLVLRSKKAIFSALQWRPEVLTDILRIDGRALGTLPLWFRDNSVLCWAACCPPTRLSGCQWMSERLKDSFVLMRHAIQRNASSYHWASARLRSFSLPLLEMAITGGNGAALHTALDPLRKSRVAAQRALLLTQRMAMLPTEIRADKTFIMQLAGVPELRHIRVGLGLCETQDMKGDALFQLELVRRAPGTIAEVPLRTNSVFLRAALAENPWLIAEKVVQRLVVCLNVAPRFTPEISRFYKGPSEAETIALGDEPTAKRRKLGEELKCPICLDIVRGRVLQCRNGHIACAACIDLCHGNVHSCPICREQHSRDGLGRNLVAEFMASSLQSTTS